MWVGERDGGKGDEEEKGMKVAGVGAGSVAGAAAAAAVPVPLLKQFASSMREILPVLFLFHVKHRISLHFRDIQYFISPKVLE
ncbi:hypothetical protein M0804_007868 [Polistes exclamans]|nr:hypothetical protein M0804_007868 [Polistes exclamans]